MRCRLLHHAPLLHTLLAATGLLLLASAVAPTRAAADDPVRFARDVLPILSDRCFVCHGPDAGTREAELRLDLREDAVAERGWYRVIAPGAPDESELIARVRGGDGVDLMPPEGHGEPLTETEVATLERWIEQGAEYEPHWAYEPPTKPAVPDPAFAALARNEVDAFVGRALAERGLEPNDEADRATLVRRLCLTLWGLPAPLDLLDRALADEREDWFERLVDELLAHERHGEHMARQWLDAARYGDTHGLHLDNHRSIWPYRDWVIEAFASNQPYDRFVVEQLAGDLLPGSDGAGSDGDGPTRAQLVATGFNRCNPTTAEGGLIDEEYLAKYAWDRVDTTSTVFLGLTMSCAKCHDHKYDPFSMRDYYALYSFFDDVQGEASDRNVATPEPTLAVPGPELEAELERRRAEIAALATELEAPNPAWDREQDAWHAAVRATLAGLWTEVALDDPIATSDDPDAPADATRFEARDDGAYEAVGAHADFGTYTLPFDWGADALRAVRLEVLPGRANGRVGRAGHGNIVIGAARLERFDGSAWRAVPFDRAEADFEQPNYAVAGVLDDDPKSGWALQGATDAPHAARLRLADPAAPGRFRLVLEMRSAHHQHFPSAVRVSGTSSLALHPLSWGTWLRSPVLRAEGDAHPFGVDLGPEPGGATNAVEWEAIELANGRRIDFAGDRAAVYLRRDLVVREPVRLSAFVSSDDGIEVWLDERRVHANDAARGFAPRQDELVLDLEPGEHTLLFKVINQLGGFAFAFEVTDELGALPPTEVAAILARDDAEWTDDERARLRTFYRSSRSAEWAEKKRALDGLEAELAMREAGIPRTLILRDQAEPVETRVLVRGLYDHPGEVVESDVPQVFGGLPADAPRNRLGLARWIVDPTNPLTARVAVNRVWQQHFGRGLVTTPEDFGLQGAWPSHPELLDWLAVSFVEHGWDLAWLHTTILTSATWRQSSDAPVAAWKADPDNRWLARGPRFRVDAEVLRDAALFVSGLLVDEVGGPSVKPYQPGGLWRAVAYPSSNTADFVRDDGDALYRRSLYTYWKRTSAPPALTLLDAPSREFCVVLRERTNTPLQALVLLNDEQHVEAARVFAARAQESTAGDLEAVIAHLVRACLARGPDDEERAILRGLFDAAHASYADDPAAARALLGVGEAPTPMLDDAAASELAALTLVAQTVLNLDATLNLR